MAGLRMICKMYGSMGINGKRFVWDYAADEPVPEAEMPYGSERHVKSEMAKGADALPRGPLHCAATGCEGCTDCTPNAVLSGRHDQDKHGGTV